MSVINHNQNLTRSLPEKQAHAGLIRLCGNIIVGSVNRYHHVEGYLDKVLRCDQLTFVVVVPAINSLELIQQCRKLARVAAALMKDTSHVVRCLSPGRRTFYNESVSELIECLELEEADTDPQLMNFSVVAVMSR
jgi:hypothetical protein